MSFVVALQQPMATVLRQFGATVTYTPLGKASANFKAFVRGLREEDLFVEAQQRDSVAILNAEDFAIATGEATPRRLDKLTVPTGTYTVEAWRAAPESGPAVFYKLLLRGGQQ